MLAVLGLLSMISLWFVWLVFPHAAAIRWPIFAPIVGMALVTIIGLPLALLGVPVANFAPALAISGSILTILVFARLLKSDSGKRRIFTWIQHRGLCCAGAFLLVVGVSATMMTIADKDDVREIWGSGDFGAYWIVADFLQENGANMSEYAMQQKFNSRDIADHLTKHARLGCMVTQAFCSAILSPQYVYQIINPLIVAALLLMVGLAQYWIDCEKLNIRWLIVLVILHPFLYFLLFFSYASQASGIILFIGGIFIAGTHKCNPIQVVLSGGLIGAGILHYPTILFAAGVFWILQLGPGIYYGHFSKLFLGPLIALCVCAVYVPTIVTELSWAFQKPTLPGWNWRGIVGALEFIGLRPVIGYRMPEPRSVLLWITELFVLGFFLIFLLFGLFHSRLRVASWTMATTTALLVAVAFLKYLQCVPHSNHAIVKALSMFTIFLCLIVFAESARWLVVFPSKISKLILYSVFALLTVGQVFALYRSEYQESWYSNDLIKLSRRVLDRSSSTPVRIIITNPRERKNDKQYDFSDSLNFNLHWQMAAPIARNQNRVINDGAAFPSTCIEIIHFKDSDFVKIENLIVDKEGDYYALEKKRQPINSKKIPKTILIN